MTKKDVLENTTDQDEKPNADELKRLQGEVERLRGEAAAQRAILKEFEASRAGWLVECPNLLFDGVGAYKLKFTDGACFLSDTQEVPYFVLPPIETDAALREQVLSHWSEPRFQEFVDKKFLEEKFQELKSNLLEARKVSSVERCVANLRGQFQYACTHYNSDQWDELQTHLKARHAQRIAFEEGRPKDGLDRLYAKLSTKESLGDLAGL